MGLLEYMEQSRQDLIEETKNLLDEQGFVQILDEVFYYQRDYVKMRDVSNMLSDKLSWLLFELIRDGKKYAVEASAIQNSSERPWPDTMRSYQMPQRSFRQSVLVKKVPTLDFVVREPTPLPYKGVSAHPTWTSVWAEIKELVIEDFKLMCKGESLRKYK